MKKLVIAIDGPAGAGKSTIGKELANRLGVPYFSTGGLYRALAVKCLKFGLDARDEKVAEYIANSTQVDVKYDGQAQLIFLDGVDVSNEIYKDEVSDKASQISVHPVIRQKLVDIQRSLAEKQSIIMDGRDIGSVVLPNANYKFYLDADVKVRAERRFQELVKKGQNVTFEHILEEMIERDRRDKSRANSPLVICEDAHIIDCSKLNISHVVDEFIKVIEKEEKL